MKRQLILKEYAGQKCDVEMFVREDDSSYVRFKSVPAYGFPYLSKEELADLLKHLKMLEEMK